MNFLDINNTLMSVSGYSVSYLEFLATVFGLISVYCATQRNILTWPAGIINEFGFFCLFYQIGLYAGMLSQVIFFIITVCGWIYWKKQNKPRRHSREGGNPAFKHTGEFKELDPRFREDDVNRPDEQEREISDLTKNQWLVLIATMIIGTLLFNFLISHLHIMFPAVIHQAAVQPMIDSWIAVTSILAVVLLAKKIISSWILWILIDLISIGLFFSQGVYLIAVEYCIFLAMAIYGYISWRKISV